VDQPYPDDVMTAASAAIVDALEQHHVTDVRWFRAWRGQPIVWLVTETRAEGAALVQQPGVENTVRSLLAESGVPNELASRAVVALKSQETIDQSFRGSWTMAIQLHPRDTHEVMNDAVPAIVAALGECGVTDVEWMVGYHGYPVCQLITTTDAEKAVVVEHDHFRDTVVQHLAEAGVPSEPLEQAAVTVQSQETVDRDFEGRWLYTWM
jgi:hypothetical protein